MAGTPLHGGVDDLNGELDFLVWLFCLSDQTDGFWAHRIGVPFANRDASAYRFCTRCFAAWSCAHQGAAPSRPGRC